MLTNQRVRTIIRSQEQPHPEPGTLWIYKVKKHVDDEDVEVLVLYYYENGEWKEIGFVNGGSITPSGEITQEDLNKLQKLLEDEFKEYSVPQIIWTTWSELKRLRDNSQLIPGAYYRITDYVATTTYAESRSANHPFDIIVLATDVNKLSEEAKAALHKGDSHFAAVSKLDAWRVWYSLDNNTGRFAWADQSNGKGVVYRLIDEFENDLPYDFKGIQFKRYKIISTTLSAMNPLIGLYFGGSDGGGSLYTGMGIDTSDYRWFYTFTKLGNTWDDPIEDASYHSASYTTNVVFDTSRFTDSNNHIPQLLNNVFAYGPVVRTLCNSISGDTSTYSPFSYFTNIRITGSDCKLNTILGAPGLIRTADTFRKNFIFGSFRHHEIGTNFQQNTICTPYDFGFCNFGEHTENNIIFCKRTLGQCSFGHSFKGNKIDISESAQGINFGSWFFSNNISATGIFYTEFGHDVNNCMFTNTYLGSVCINGQLTHCTFTGRFLSCTFNPICQYIDFVGGTGDSYCVGLDVVGNVRGTQETHINIENTTDFIYPNSSGIKRRIRLEGDTNGTNVIISWYSDGKLVRKTKGASGDTWTELIDEEISGNFKCSTNGDGVVLKSPNGTSYKITVADDGTVQSTLVA